MILKNTKPLCAKTKMLCLSIRFYLFVFVFAVAVGGASGHHDVGSPRTLCSIDGGVGQQRSFDGGKRSNN